jgi:hypothetical protein
MIVILCAIALVLLLSIAITSGVGHGLDQVTLALPILFVFLLLATSIGDWLQIEDIFVEAQARFSSSLTRGPPA